MDPLGGATTLATLVGLLGQFLDERDKREAATISEYLEWLRRQNHRELADGISRNTILVESLRVLLAEQHDELVTKLCAIETTVTFIASRIPGLQAVARAIHPDAVLSDQSASVLQQMNAAGASKFLEVSTRGGDDYIFMDADGALEITEPRFINDDLGILCELGLLRLDYNDSGSRLFIVTRQGAKIGGM